MALEPLPSTNAIARDAWKALFGIKGDRVPEWAERDLIRQSWSLDDARAAIGIMRAQGMDGPANQFERFLDRAKTQQFSNYAQAVKAIGDVECAPAPPPRPIPTEDELERQFMTSGVPAFLAKKTPALAEVPVDKTRHDAVRKWLADAKKGESRMKGLLLCSPTPGNGKTTIATACYRAIFTETIKRDGGINARWVSSTEFFAGLKREMFDKSSDEVDVDDLIRADLLLIDDLGKEKASEWVREVLFRVIDARHLTRTTIITSNFTAEGLISHVGESIVSRIYGAFLQIEFKGPDYRRTMQESA